MKQTWTKHILVYRLSALGDVAMTIPAVYSVARAWPDCCFHVVTSTFCTQLYINAPCNVVVHGIEKHTGTWRLIGLLRAIPVDMVADLHNVLRSWIVDAYFRLRGKRVRMVDKMRSERKAILSHRQASTRRPFTLRYFDVFQRLGLPAEPDFTSLSGLPPVPPLSLTGQPAASSLPPTGQPPVTVALDKGTERWIGIAPFARYQTKVYPMEQMREVVRLLSLSSTTRVFLFGSRGSEADELKQWEQLSPRVHTVAGQFTLPEELALMARLDTMVTMDSANMHLASLVGTRVVSVWGSTTPACGFMGYGQNADDALYASLPCQPCSTAGSTKCRLGTLECLKQLQPEAIVQRLAL